MSITVKEIAVLANCSATTVSKVLNNRDMNISEATKAKIMAIAAEHNYIPNIMAKSLRGQKTHTLGFILPDITNPYFSRIARGIEDAAQKRNFSIIYSDTDIDPERVHNSLNFLTSHMVDGIIFDQIVSPFNIEFLPKNIPVVILDRLENGNISVNPSFGKVYSDTLNAVYNMTRLHLQCGKTKPAYISTQPLSEADRYYGFFKALEEEQIPFDERLSYWGIIDPETGAAGIRKFLNSGLEFDCVICGNDVIAVGALDTLKKSGYRIPEDISVSGIGDVPLVQYLTPSLTTVAQFSYEMGEIAVNMLIDHILGGSPLYQKKFDYQIIRRESL